MMRVMRAAFLLCAAASLLAGAPQAHPSEDQLYRLEPRQVVLPDFKAEGYILDIGGGGAGVIGRLKRSQVIAIDLYKRELEEAPAGPLKIVMDAKDLKFLDGSFRTATSFFTLMFVKQENQKKVLEEVYRVLAPGGRFLVWDADIPERLDKQKNIAVFQISVKLPAEEIKSGYGTPWPQPAYSAAYYTRLAREAGFEVRETRQDKGWFFLELTRP
jgi:ubiquinone/menaquinone biosynthesis C-methylase UbiE